MLVFDQLKKDDSQLRFLAVVVASGMGVLFVGLWWVQVVSANYYQDKLQNQSIRTVRLPAVRGNILDRDGRPLAESRPSYNINLYLEDLSPNFQAAYSAAVGRERTNQAIRKVVEKKKLNRELSRSEGKLFDRQFVVSMKRKEEIQQQTRFEVSSNIVSDLAARLQQPIPFEARSFQKTYSQARALPMPILANLGPPQVARFQEQSMHTPGMDMEIQSLRYYPHGSLAFHVLGYLAKNVDSSEGEQSDYSYRLNDYSGVVGIEWLYDSYLRGSAGSKSVLVDNLGYRRSESVVSPTEPGNNVVLTIDLDIQTAAESALKAQMANIRGAVVVMNATNGDILAMASAPTFDPNLKVSRPDPEVWAAENARFNDNDLKVQQNRATFENYHPGSIFKIVVALAGLELGTLHPEETFVSDHVHPNGKAYWPVGKKEVDDTAPPGKYDLNRAMALSCNSYFIYNGLKPGVLPKVIELGQKLHFGERTGLIPRQETSGTFPSPRQISYRWGDGDTANLCIGQGYLDVTPLQIAVLGAAVANGGRVLYPRLASRIESFDGSQILETFPEGRVRDNLGVSGQSLKLVREGMLADVESSEGSGHEVSTIPGFRIAGKTGTAEVEHNRSKDQTDKHTWFLSFGPYEKPRYVVVVMVEGGASGKISCVPIAHKVYDAIIAREQQRQKMPAARGDSLAQMR